MEIPVSSDITIRSWRKNDSLDLVKHANNKKIADFLRDVFPYPYTLRDADMWISFASNQNPQRNFAISKNDSAIGGIGVSLRTDVYARNAEIGYWLGEPHWGKGIMTSCVVSFSHWVFDFFNVHRIFASVFHGNAASRRLLEKAGFRHEGTHKQAVYKNECYLDEHIYAIIRD